MKKIYSLMCAGLFSFGVLVAISAQVSAQIAAPFKVVDNNSKPVGLGTSITKAPVNPNPVSVTSTESFWLNDAAANDYVIGQGTALVGAYPVFPDSTVLFTFSNGNFATFVDLCGNVLDPLAANMQTAFPADNWNQYNAYTVDSMAVGITYVRSTADNIVDTMVVYLYNDSNPVDVLTYTFGAPEGMLEENFGITDTIADTLVWKGMLYDYRHNQPLDTNLSNLHIFKVPLTVADTAVGGLNKTFSTGGFHVPAGGHAVSAVGFIPGYAYNEGDVITGTYNQFGIIYYTENGMNSFPTYFGTGGFTTGMKDWNVSEIVRTEEEYNEVGNSWNGNFLPEWAFTEAYPFNEWDISYLVTSIFNVGIHESISPMGTVLYQNQPNPSNHTTVIKYDTQTEGAAVLQVTDLTGRIVMEMNQGTQSAGSHSVTIDISGLSQGMYMYTLRTNDASLTRRMVISE